MPTARSTPPCVGAGLPAARTLLSVFVGLQRGSWFSLKRMSRRLLTGMLPIFKLINGFVIAVRTFASAKPPPLGFICIARSSQKRRCYDLKTQHATMSPVSIHGARIAACCHAIFGVRIVALDPSLRSISFCAGNRRLRYAIKRQRNHCNRESSKRSIRRSAASGKSSPAGQRADITTSDCCRHSLPPDPPRPKIRALSGCLDHFTRPPRF